MISVKSIAPVFFLQVAAITLLPSLAYAESKVAGYVNGTKELLSTIELADGNIAKRVKFQVTVITDDTANPIHLASQDCFATYVFTRDDKPVGGRGSCDGISADGHIWWIDTELRPDGKVYWANRGGMGKFEDLTGSGTTTELAEFPDGKTINRFEGSYSN